jgi:hypothetical protein
LKKLDQNFFRAFVALFNQNFPLSTQKAAAINLATAFKIIIFSTLNPSF